MRVLLVEDDPVLGDGLQVGLTLEGHTVDWLRDGDEARDAPGDQEFGVIILDLGLPGCPGQVLLNEWRRSGVTIPILILTALEGSEACIEALDSGADEYCLKPVDLAELTARLRALQRRAAGRVDNHLTHGPLSLDQAARAAFLTGKPLDLSAYEFSVLEALAERFDRTVTRQTLESRLYGWDDGPESNSLEVLVHKLRAKLGRERIRTVRGVGYRLVS